MNVFVAPLEIVNYPFVSQFLFHYEQILEKLSDSFVNVKMVKLRNHSFLVFQVFFVLIY